MNARASVGKSVSALRGKLSFRNLHFLDVAPRFHVIRCDAVPNCCHKNTDFQVRGRLADLLELDSHESRACVGLCPSLDLAGDVQVPLDPAVEPTGSSGSSYAEMRASRIYFKKRTTFRCLWWHLMAPWLATYRASSDNHQRLG